MRDQSGSYRQQGYRCSTILCVGVFDHLIERDILDRGDKDVALIPGRKISQ